MISSLLLFFFVSVLLFERRFYILGRFRNNYVC